MVLNENTAITVSKSVDTRSHDAYNPIDDIDDLWRCYIYATGISWTFIL